MRIEKLELNKIKVTVFPVDLNDMNVSIKNLKPDSPQLHSFLFRIMERVKKETGFNPYSGKIVVEALPIGDCIELTVTKLSDADLPSKHAKKPKHIKATLKNPTKKDVVYCFECFDDLCNCLLNMNKSLPLNTSYYEMNGKHILLIPEINLNDNTLMREFASSADRRLLSRSFLDEHAKLIAKDDELQKMSDGILELYKPSI